jgi:ABC-type transport system substrate-binding protein
VTIVATSVFGSLAGLAEQLAAIGLRSTVRSVPYGEMATAEVETAEAWVWAWVADYPDPAGMMTLFELLGSLPRDDEIGRLLHDARSIRDRDERLRLYREADRLLVAERVVIVPLAYGRSSTHVRLWIDGFWINAVAFASLADLVVRPEERPDGSVRIPNN